MLTYKQQEETTYRSERKEVSMAKTIRHSRQREKIYNYLVDAIEHPTAEMIHTALREEIPGLSLGTVYRNLNLLEELGKISSASPAVLYGICTVWTLQKFRKAFRWMKDIIFPDWT